MHPNNESDKTQSSNLIAVAVSRRSSEAFVDDENNTNNNNSTDQLPQHQVYYMSESDDDGIGNGNGNGNGTGTNNYNNNLYYYPFYQRSPVDYPPTPAPHLSPSYVPFFEAYDPPNTPTTYFSYSPPTPTPTIFSPVNLTSPSSHSQASNKTYNNNNKEEAVQNNNNNNNCDKTNVEEGSFLEASNSSSSVFDCNICYDMAKEPVVTSCGHLYCWPCLYYWLNYHCNSNQCPVCNGEVHQSMITPIYGQATHYHGTSTVKIPPRPFGRRF